MTDETIGNAINPKERICKNCKHFSHAYTLNKAKATVNSVALAFAVCTISEANEQ